ncbi:MAG TPA: hypothetical protein VGT61_00790 [Thermomicrobiales bacterium]|nr:hypothetical protein [Thermomicrobiales bacterium]
MTRKMIVGLLLTLLLVLPLGVGSAPRAGAQLEESITSTFQVYECPENYEGLDYLDDCSPVGAGDYAITVTDTHPTEPEATTETDADGFVSFATVPGDTTWSLRLNETGAYYFSCFDGDGVYLFDGRQPQIHLDVSEGDVLSCRWYVTPLTSGTSSIDLDNDPADATVGVQVFDCPEGFDPSADVLTDYRQGCDPTERPVGVTLNDGHEMDEATMTHDQAGDDGRAGFVNLLSGAYFLAIEDLSTTTGIFHACTDVTQGGFLNGREIYGTRGTHNRIRLSLAASDDVSCEIFLTSNAPATPEAGSEGTVTLSVMGCPLSFEGPDWTASCNSPIDFGYAFMFDPANPEGFTGDPADGVELFEGVAVFQDVPPGEFRVTTGIPGHGAEFHAGCVMGAGPVPDDQIAMDGNMVSLNEGEGASCVIYVTPLDLRG